MSPFTSVLRLGTLSVALCASVLPAVCQDNSKTLKDTQAAPAATTWLANRFAGAGVPTSCAQQAPPPVSTALPGHGDLTVALNNWTLSGTAGLKKLGQSATIPAGSTFNGTADVTSGDLDGAINIPPFNTTVTIAGIGVKTALSLVPTGNVTGTVSLDDNGDLHLFGIAPVIVHIKSLSAFGAQFGTNCVSDHTMHIPIKYDGSIGNLGAGKLTSNTIATFPNFTNCGIYGPILDTLISGGGNAFNLTETPPAPTVY